jgi:surface antigen
VAAITVLAPHQASRLVSIPIGGAVSDATRSGAIIQRLPTAPAIAERPAQTVVAGPGDTIEHLAATLHGDAGAMRWANRIADGREPVPGTPLLVPPGPGALVQVRPGESPSQFGSRLGIDPRSLLDYNRLASDTPLAPGTWLQVAAHAAPARSLPSTAVVPTEAGQPGVPSTQFARASAGRFPFGQCTYYVWTRRYVPWNGDAWAWFRNAQEFGRPTGQLPAAGAIAVMWGSWVGHVAFVERVNPDGSFVISEMNHAGWGVVDQRTITASSVDLIGFIY